MRTAVESKALAVWAPAASTVASSASGIVVESSGLFGSGVDGVGTALPFTVTVVVLGAGVGVASCCAGTPV